MFPTALHFIRHKGAILGSVGSVGYDNVSNKSVALAFISNEHAIYVKNFIKNNNFNIKQITYSRFVLNNKPSKHFKPLSKSHTSIDTYMYDVGVYYASVNNLDIALIDKIRLKNKDSLELFSHFTADVDEIEPVYIADQFEKVLNGDKIDYMIDYTQMLIFNNMILDENEDF